MSLAKRTGHTPESTSPPVEFRSPVAQGEHGPSLTNGGTDDAGLSGRVPSWDTRRYAGTAHGRFGEPKRIREVAGSRERVIALSGMATVRNDSSLTVLVLADRIEVALPACRALRRGGHVVGAATSAGTPPVSMSKAVTHKHVFPGSSDPQEAWESALALAVSQRAYDLVLACNDVDVLRLTVMKPSVATVPSISSVQAVVLDKAALDQVCADVGVKYPRTYAPGTPSHDVTIATGGSARTVVKAATPAVMTDGGIVHIPGMTTASDPRAVVSAMERYRAAGLRPILQEHVDGPKLQATIIRREGATLCRFVALVERGTPAEATLLQLDSSADIGGECIAALERVADRAGYAGILQAEFIATPVGVCLIDLNPRLWGGLAFAELVGLRMTERAAYDALGLSAPAIPREAPGRRYHHAARELAYLLRSPRDVRSVVSRWSRNDVWDVPPFNDMRPHIEQSFQQARSSWQGRTFRRKGRLSATR